MLIILSLPRKILVSSGMVYDAWYWTCIYNIQMFDLVMEKAICLGSLGAIGDSWMPMKVIIDSKRCVCYHNIFPLFLLKKLQILLKPKISNQFIDLLEMWSQLMLIIHMYQEANENSKSATKASSMKSTDLFGLQLIISMFFKSTET